MGDHNPGFHFVKFMKNFDLQNRTRITAMNRGAVPPPAVPRSNAIANVLTRALAP